MSIVIPEQLVLLRKSQQELQKKLTTFDDYRSNRETSELDVLHAVVASDFFVDSDYYLNKSKLDEVNDTLLNSVYLKKRVVDHIEVGTKFLFQFFGEEEICDYILVEDAISVGSINGFISIKSPIGKQVLNKKAGESLTNFGTIVDIETDSSNYIHFLRENDISVRTCYFEKQRLKDLKKRKMFEIEALQEWNNRQMITVSQKELLEIEKSRIAALPPSDVMKQRLEEIDRILKNTLVAVPNDEDTIGIGTKVDLMFFNGNGIETKHVEMINQAVSDELDSEYIERISPLGSQIFGLRKDEKFVAQLDKRRNQYMRGKVLNVDNSFSLSLHSSPYQKRK